eukprot:1223268-Rhodomonas_salina.1
MGVPSSSAAHSTTEDAGFRWAGGNGNCFWDVTIKAPRSNTAMQACLKHLLVQIWAKKKGAQDLLPDSVIVKQQSHTMQKATEYRVGENSARSTACGCGVVDREDDGEIALRQRFNCAAAEDSNVENIGSAMDKAQRMAAATTDVQWDGVSNTRLLIVDDSLLPKTERFVIKSLAEVCPSLMWARQERSLVSRSGASRTSRICCPFPIGPVTNLLPPSFV